MHLCSAPAQADQRLAAWQCLLTLGVADAPIPPSTAKHDQAASARKNACMTARRFVRAANHADAASRDASAAIRIMPYGAVARRLGLNGDGNDAADMDALPTAMLSPSRCSTRCTKRRTGLGVNGLPLGEYAAAWLVGSLSVGLGASNTLGFLSTDLTSAGLACAGLTAAAAAALEALLPLASPLVASVLGV